MYDRLKEIVNKSDNVVFFGGAGVSTESGIPDFRSAAGLYATETHSPYPPEEMLSHTFFMKHPAEFFAFYKSKMIFRDAKPNAAHTALAELETRGRLKALVTQNIDGLHQAAGSSCVIELHGSVHRNYCMDCGKRYGLEEVTGSEGLIPRCGECGGIVRPDVVLYEEMLDDRIMRQAIKSISRADVLIVGGTSLAVYPAAGLIRYYEGDNLVLINKTPTPYDGVADMVIHESVGQVLSALI